MKNYYKSNVFNEKITVNNSISILLLYPFCFPKSKGIGLMALAIFRPDGTDCNIVGMFMSYTLYFINRTILETIGNKNIIVTRDTVAIFYDKDNNNFEIIRTTFLIMLTTIQ